MISAIIPTYNRLEKLKKTLQSGERQSLAKNKFEVIVVDDGGTDGTGAFMEEFIKTSRLDLKYFYLPHRGPERARNFGAEKAAGDIIFFCGDDTWWEENLLAIHDHHHRQTADTALLGLALWDESRLISEFMRYLAPAGPQFHYNTIKNANDAGFSHFYTCNISLAKKWLEREKFDESLNYAFEDIELGLRLERRGLRVIFNPAAKVYHWHYYDQAGFSQRMERVGRGAIIFFDKYKNQRNTLNLLKRKYAPFAYFPGVKIFNRLSGRLAASELLKKINLKYHWFWLICYDYSRGMLNQLQEKHV